MTPRITTVTLGVRDLKTATAFYEAIFGVQRVPGYEEISFFRLPGCWLSLYPIAKLAEDISPTLDHHRSTFAGVTFAHHVTSRDEVQPFLDRAIAAGGTLAKPAQDTFWGGYDGYFADPDGYHWEILWGPMFEYGPDGNLRFTQCNNVASP